MKKDSQFLYRTSKSRIKDIKIKAIEEGKPVNEILDHLIDEFLGKETDYIEADIEEISKIPKEIQKQIDKDKDHIKKAKKEEEATRDIKLNCKVCEEVKKGSEFGFIKKTLKRDTMCRKCRNQKSKENLEKRILEGREW